MRDELKELMENLSWKVKTINEQMDQLSLKFEKNFKDVLRKWLWQLKYCLLVGIGVDKKTNETKTKALMDIYSDFYKELREFVTNGLKDMVKDLKCSPEILENFCKTPRDTIQQMIDSIPNTIDNHFHYISSKYFSEANQIKELSVSVQTKYQCYYNQYGDNIKELEKNFANEFPQLDETLEDLASNIETSITSKVVKPIQTKMVEIKQILIRYFTNEPLNESIN